MSGDECECPVTRAAAEVERFLFTTGVRRSRFGSGGMARALLVAALRDKHGCPGPGRGMRCPWDAAIGITIGGDVEPDDGVPEVRAYKPDHRDRGTGLYL